MTIFHIQIHEKFIQLKWKKNIIQMDDGECPCFTPNFAWNFKKQALKIFKTKS